MGDLINRLGELHQNYKSGISFLEGRVDTELDYDGGAKSVLSLNYRFLAICEFINNKNKIKFQELLSKSASLVAKNFQDYNSGKITETIYVKWNRFYNILDSYASLDTSAAEDIAKYIGNLDIDKKEKGFFPALSYSIKYLVLEDDKCLKIYSNKLSDYLDQKNAKNYLGYAEVIKAYINKDIKLVQKGFDTMLANHKQLCKGRGEYSNTEDEIIFLHGLGLLNLVRSRGFDIKLSDKLIPEDLIIK
ncbi:hypothetical protein [Leptospira kanakyensis]|uniref:hypothetical protein n=1 Tax=Leptospira kanakyensis TaxID=2484968 RepID=UPI00223CD0C7|nr:hypothetical protein [Leptospira kanakyensis]MCW7471816.1 hypothetical protein [Leptospira kanakyensis]